MPRVVNDWEERKVTLTAQKVERSRASSKKKEPLCLKWTGIISLRKIECHVTLPPSRFTEVYFAIWLVWWRTTSCTDALCAWISRKTPEKQALICVLRSWAVPVEQFHEQLMSSVTNYRSEDKRLTSMSTGSSWQWQESGSVLQIYGVTVRSAQQTISIPVWMSCGLEKINHAFQLSTHLYLYYCCSATVANELSCKSSS